MPRLTKFMLFRNGDPQILMVKLCGMFGQAMAEVKVQNFILKYKSLLFETQIIPRWKVALFHYGLLLSKPPP